MKIRGSIGKDMFGNSFQNAPGRTILDMQVRKSLAGTSRVLLVGQIESINEDRRGSDSQCAHYRNRLRRQVEFWSNIIGLPIQLSGTHGRPKR